MSIICVDTVASRHFTLPKFTAVQDIPAIIARVDDLLADHNAASRRPMNLAVFLYAAEHVARAVRVLRQPGGHLLSIGVGGSGRASVARLAASIAGMDTQQIEVTKSYGMAEWKEDLKKFTRLCVSRCLQIPCLQPVECLYGLWSILLPWIALCVALHVSTERFSATRSFY